MSPAMLVLSIGAGILAMSAFLWIPLRDLYRREPAPAIIRSWFASEMLLISYFCFNVIGIALCIRGLADL